jgi:hypothetical protein
VATPQLPDFRSELPPAKEHWSGDHPIVACFADRCLQGRLRDVIRGLNREPVFTVAFSLAELSGSMPDLVAVTRIYTSGDASAPVSSSLIFTGYVETLGWNGNEATVKASPMVGFKTQRIGGLAVLGVGPGEIMWTMARIGGFTPSEIKIGGDWPPPPEDFFVVAPIDGVNLDFAETVGDVIFTPDRGLRAQWKAGAGPDRHGIGNEYLHEFHDTKVAALTTTRASLALDAERAGLSRIEAAAARLALASRHSRAIGLNGKPRPFSRDRLRERVRLRPVVGVLSKQSERQWIRGVDTTQDETSVTAGSLTGMRDALQKTLDDRTAESIKAWRRATLSADPASAVVALAEALEFYAAGSSVEALFSAEDLDRARTAAVATGLWTETQRKRLAEVVSRANDAPFFVRLGIAVAADGLDLTSGETALLRKMRDQRNDLLHGRERQDPNPDELTAAVALVGRLLLSRLARLGVR